VTSTLTIRAAEEADLAAVADHWCALQRAHAPFHPCWELAPGARDRFLAALRAALAHEGAALRVVAEPTGRIVGYCLGRTIELPPHASEARLGVVESIHVERAARDAGVGSALLAAVVEELRRAGAGRVEVTVSADNDGAIRFLERARFGLHTVTLTRDA
jgi:ribosomal protein S18 acetylase RimI-like enzyme